MEVTNPVRTNELPTATIENFAEFIITNRSGKLSQDHLQAVFAMKVNKLTMEGVLPNGDHLSQTGKNYYRAKIHEASEVVKDSLGADDEGDWSVYFETQPELEAFIDEQASLFAELLQSKLTEENNG